jgi:hypothetical protein
MLGDVDELIAPAKAALTGERYSALLVLVGLDVALACADGDIGAGLADYRAARRQSSAHFASRTHV